MPMEIKRSLIFLLLGLVIILFFLDLLLGSVRIPLETVWEILLGNEAVSQSSANIIYKFRIPKACTAILAGAALSVGGLQMQTLFRNPLAGPSVLGITSGASLGVAVVMLAGGSAISMFAIGANSMGRSGLIILASTLGAALILLIVLALSIRIRDNTVILILGIMMGFITTALVSIWQYFSEPSQIQDYLIWTFGSLHGVTDSSLILLSIAVLLGIFMTFLNAKSLNMLLLGEAYARSMGLRIHRARSLIIVTTSLLAGAVTAFCGPIGFVGIAVPHLTRALLRTTDHRVLIPSTCLAGAIIMLVCDIIAQLPGSSIALPINAVTALIGAPVVIGVILNRRNLKSSF